MSEPRSAAEMLVRRHFARDDARRRRRGSPWRIALAAVAACGLFFGAVLLGASLFVAYVKGGSDTWDARILESSAGEPLVAIAYLFAAAMAIGTGCLFYRLKEPHAFHRLGRALLLQLPRGHDRTRRRRPAALRARSFAS